MNSHFESLSAALESMGENSRDEVVREALYSQARIALSKTLRTRTPLPTEEEISAESDALEAAITTVEMLSRGNCPEPSLEESLVGGATFSEDTKYGKAIYQLDIALTSQEFFRICNEVLSLPIGEDMNRTILLKLYESVPDWGDGSQASIGESIGLVRDQLYELYLPGEYALDDVAESVITAHLHLIERNLQDKSAEHGAQALNDWIVDELGLVVEEEPKPVSSKSGLISDVLSVFLFSFMGIAFASTVPYVHHFEYNPFWAVIIYSFGFIIFMFLTFGLLIAALEKLTGENYSDDTSADDLERLQKGNDVTLGRRAYDRLGIVLWIAVCVFPLSLFLSSQFLTYEERLGLLITVLPYEKNEISEYLNFSDAAVVTNDMVGPDHAEKMAVATQEQVRKEDIKYALKEREQRIVKLKQELRVAEKRKALFEQSSRFRWLSCDYPNEYTETQVRMLGSCITNRNRKNRENLERIVEASGGAFKRKGEDGYSYKGVDSEYADIVEVVEDHFDDVKYGMSRLWRDVINDVKKGLKRPPHIQPDVPDWQQAIIDVAAKVDRQHKEKVRQAGGEYRKGAWVNYEDLPEVIAQKQRELEEYMERTAGIRASLELERIKKERTRKENGVVLSCYRVAGELDFDNIDESAADLRRRVDQQRQKTLERFKLYPEQLDSLIYFVGAVPYWSYPYPNQVLGGGYVESVKYYPVERIDFMQASGAIGRGECLDGYGRYSSLRKIIEAWVETRPKMRRLMLDWEHQIITGE